MIAGLAKMFMQAQLVKVMKFDFTHIKADCIIEGLANWAKFLHGWTP
jgi:hypothetical protein